ncbi:transcriptional regulatory protein [Paramyrothecium foliicola]|nr:transcriptional regulatory protein [Paramyrothecium foliicola]
MEQGAPAAARPQKKSPKRSSNACTRCRKQKIKCSGFQPCEGCSKRKVTCNFEDSDSKVVVSRAYLVEIQRKLRRAEQQSATAEDGTIPASGHESTAREGSISVASGPRHEDDSTLDNDASRTDTVGGRQSSEDRESNQPALTNPLADSPSTFMSASNGRTFYLGTSSNWSFAGKILQLTYSHVHQGPIPPHMLLFDGSAYDLEDSQTPGAHPPEPLAIPSIDHSLHLINAVKFHCGQMYHLFEEEAFHDRLQRYYSDPDPVTQKYDLWYIHFLLILAFGKTFTLQRPVGRRPPGSEYFIRALQLLPSAATLCLEPVISTEILCCIALYLHSVDHRHAAHTYIGQAMRTALCYGMHTEMPINQLGIEHVERCRKIWWTVYLLDRQMTSLMGLPQSVQDRDVHCQLPTYRGSPQRTSTLDMHIKLSRIVAEINDSIYGINGTLNKKFLISTKASLENIASLGSELRQALPLRLDQPGFGVSRASASMYLLYHEVGHHSQIVESSKTLTFGQKCIVLATRPLIFCCLKLKLESVAEPNISTHDRISTLLQMCIDSAQQIISILENLHLQGLLETFLSVDLDALYVASIILLVGSVIDKQLMRGRRSWVLKTTSLLEQMETGGSLVATWRKAEIQQLDEIVSKILDNGVKSPSSSNAADTGPSFHSLFQPGTFQDFAPMHNMGMAGFANGEDILADQIMAIANSIQDEDAEWMDRAVLENSIW